MSNIKTPAEFEDVLVDVRKAYRLIYLYQRRILDLVKYIGDSLTYRYKGGWSWFSDNTPRDGKGSLDNWAWDWLNMYFYEFDFEEKEISQNKIHFSIVVQSDTGYFDSNPHGENALNINEFISPEMSSTKVIFFIGKNCWHNNEEFRNDFEDDSEYFKKTLAEYVKQIDKGILLSKSFYLSDFINPEKTKESLKIWIAFCNKNGVKEIGISN